MSKQIKSFKLHSTLATAVMNKVINAEGASPGVSMLTPESINKLCEMYATEGFKLTKRDKFIDLLGEPNKFKEIYDEFFKHSNKLFKLSSKKDDTNGDIQPFLKQCEVFGLRDQEREYYIKDFYEKNGDLKEPLLSEVNANYHTYKSTFPSFKYDAELNKFFSSDNSLSIENQCFFNDECLTTLARKSSASQKSFNAIMSIKYNPSIYTNFFTKELLEQNQEIYKEFTPSELQEYSDEKLKCYKTAEGFYNAGLTCNKDTFNSNTCIPPKLCNSYYGIAKKIISICEDFYPLDATPKVEDELAKAFSGVALLDPQSDKILLGTTLSDE
jgi:hypothetical protein